MMSPAKLLHMAHAAAGGRAVAAAAVADYPTARKWQALTAEIFRLLRDAVEIEAARSGEAVASRNVDVLEREAPHLLAASERPGYVSPIAWPEDEA